MAGIATVDLRLKYQNVGNTQVIDDSDLTSGITRNAGETFYLSKASSYLHLSNLQSSRRGVYLRCVSCHSAAKNSGLYVSVAGILHLSHGQALYIQVESTTKVRVRSKTKGITVEYSAFGI